MKTVRIFFAIVLAAICMLYLGWSAAQADTILFQNGTTNGFNDNAVGLNGYPGLYMDTTTDPMFVANSFTLSNDSVLNGVDFTSIAQNGGGNGFTNFFVNILDPSFNPVFSTEIFFAGITSTNLGMLPGPNHTIGTLYDQQFTLPGVALTAGNYYLSIGNAQVISGNLELWAAANGGTSTVLRSLDGTTWANANTWSPGGSTFSISGTTAGAPPSDTVEASTLLLMGTGLGLLALGARRGKGAAGLAGA